MSVRSFGIFFLALLSLLPSGLSAQGSDSDIVRFMAFQDAYHVYLQWEIRAGRTCDGIRIMKSNQTESEFEEIGYIDGICGQVDVAETYNFTDVNPSAQGITWYKLIPGGFQEYKIPYHFTLVPLHHAYAWISPASGLTHIRYRQQTSALRILKVYDTSGGLRLQSESLESEWEIAAEALPPGVYLYHILEAPSLILATGRFSTLKP
jgi:hypothetical protein